MSKTRKVPLMNGGYAVVDSGDYARVSGFRWYNHHSYAYSVSTPPVFMHRLILGLTPRQRNGDGQRIIVDHVNHDGLDNRRINLRVGTHSDNMKNRATYRKLTAKGITYHRKAKKWQAQKTITLPKRKVVYLGLYPTRELAEQAFEKFHSPTKE